jgi:ATP dependent DNA ligase C terminal region
VQHVARAFTSDPGRLSFHPFDIVGDGAEYASNYRATVAQLSQWFDGATHVRVVTTVEGDGKVCAERYAEWVGGQLFEGVVARNAAGVAHKIKPMFSIDAAVVGFGTRLRDGAPELRELAVALRRDDGTWQLLGSVGGGLSLEQRLAWHQRLLPMKVESSHRLANRDGGLCTFVRPQIVIEIQCSDLITTDADERPLQRAVLEYDEASGYRGRGVAPVAAMLFPVLLRERSDKTLDAASIGLAQITSRLPQEETAAVEAAAADRAEIVERRVFVKGSTAVRKYLIVETNDPPSQRAPFVFFSTDYSAGRAEPLKTGLRCASNLAQAQVFAAAWLEENVKKGWAEAGVSAAAEATPKAPAKKAAKKSAKEASAKKSDGGESPEGTEPA